MINPLDVRELRLDQKDLSELPDEIFQLTNLTLFNISFNGICK